MSNIKIYIFLLLISPLTIYSQKEDYQWFLGRIGNENTPNDTSIFNRTRFDFNIDPMQILFDYKVWKMDFGATNTVICDTTGQMYAISNGTSIRDGTHKYMKNGDTINYDGLWEDWENGGIPVPQANLFLPWPGKDSIIYFSCRYVLDRGGSDQGRYSIIDRKANNGLGAVVDKDRVLFDGDIKYGHINAVRHANGRDWWITFVGLRTDYIKVFLLDPSGIRNVRNQTIGPRNMWIRGQSTFSQQGDQFALIHIYTWDTLVPVPIYLMNFDRCTGKFSKIRTDTIYQKYADLGFGVTFSPSGEYLYANNKYEIRQYKTGGNFAGDFTVVANYDGFYDPYPNSGNFWKSYFGYWAQGPDGMAYMVSSVANRYLHRLVYPDEEGLACDMRQHSVPIRNNWQTIPNFPNYRLGPLDGSSCDTLGLDNNPIAKYRYEGDTLDHLKVRFTDVSYFRPETWHWDFGDGTSFDGKKPYWHTFPKNGVYHVCLTVSNENSSNTLCRNVVIGTTSIADEDLPILNDRVSVFPNPTDG